VLRDRRGHSRRNSSSSSGCTFRVATEMTNPASWVRQMNCAPPA
jgi:hypothetical protein